ncbi:Alcohol dehydrogenase, class V [Handroanthus impetiginosus]|uniref:Alcohol dehydrogenase, class V n=1 Tax=Handroanthus impetiginosus TaxID=429701 RepID=A0A2G9I1P0_9LAMI|nr:Alcohol dehydrogenase, class V [Handroanthus impetiginosus]
MATSLETQHPVKAIGWAARDPSGVFAPIKFSRRATGEHDVQFRVLYCGICHSEVHLAKNEWGGTMYPLIPGHEIVGVVTEVGNKVQKFKPGDKVAVGCLVGSCRECGECKKNEESYCPKGVLSINGRDYDGTVTYGGFSNLMVTNEDFILRWPESLPLDKGAPLLCAGITTYSPLRRFGLDKPGVNVGVVGLGGIGHLTVKFAKALGCRVTVISTSPRKKKEAIETFGADEFLVSHDQEQMQAAQATLDGIIDTVSATHSLQPLLSLLKPHCSLILVGLPSKLEVPVFPLIMGGRAVVGTASGGIKQTQEMLEFSAKHNILPDVEIVPMDYVNTALERLEKNDVKYRFVIDVGNSLKDE